MPALDTTRILSREDFFRCLDKCVEQQKSGKGQLGLLLIDINRFSRINSIFGYEVGDGLLYKVGQRLLSLKRSKDVLAQIGDDEFALLTPGIQGESHALLAVNKIMNTLSSEAQINDIRIVADVSVGICLYPALAINAEGLLQGAGIALREAKVNGLPHRVFTGRDTTPIFDWDIESELGGAIKDQAFELYYQPKVDLKTRLPSGAEALMRWNHPEHGYVPVEEFIRVAEQTGQIMSMTEWSINVAMRQACELSPPFDEQKISINLSSRVLLDPYLVEYVESVINIWGINTKRLVFEVTETGIMVNPEQVFEILLRLQDMGASISIDDFGTGYSSLSYFKMLPANELKIDKAFIENITHDARDQSLVSSVIALSKGFGFHVVAEGVEDFDALTLLEQMGCDIVQGFYFSKPLTFTDYQQWLINYDPGTYWR